MATKNGSSWVALVWHIIALSSCIYGFASLSKLEDLLGVSMEDEYGGFLQFLTVCGLAGTAATMGLALLLDITNGPEALYWVKDLVMAASLPTETLITVLYWSIITINKDLMMPPMKIMDPNNPDQVLRLEPVAIPLLIDASQHAFPGVFLLVDFWFFSRRLPRSIPIMAAAAAVAIGYSLWAEKCAKMNGHFPYPLLDMMTGVQRAAFYTVVGIASCGAGTVAVRLQAKLTKPTLQARASTNNSKKSS